MTRFSHVDDAGRAKMVDVGAKQPQLRRARAGGRISILEVTARLIAENKMKKGDVLTVAEIAGITAAKRTCDLIPLCHPLGLTTVEVTATLEDNAVAVGSEVCCIGPTGVEMEALTAVSVALLTVYDMCKAVDKEMKIGEIVLREKTKRDLPPPPEMDDAPEPGLRESRRGEIVSVNVSTDKGTSKIRAPEIVINDRGVEGDAHAGAWHRQISVLAQESIDAFVARTGRETGPGDFAENITTRGIPLQEVAAFDRFEIGEVKLEISQIGKKCHGHECDIFREVGQCAMPREGIFCRVISGGKITPGDEVVHLARPLRFKVITLSDRASLGEYEDRSGPRIQELIEDFFKGARWHLEIAREILPDDADRLRAALLSARAEGVDVVITTGGTGVGPRDITPEVVESIADRTIPGIMDHIRLLFGGEKPNALLSRSVAAVAGRTLIYTLPGSVKAVNEYMGEILKTLDHLIATVRGLDTH